MNTMTSSLQRIVSLGVRVRGHTRGVHTGSALSKSIAERAKETETGLAKIKRLQEIFQKDDAVPVHLKLGARDKALYYATWAGMLVATGFSVQFLCKIAYPRAEE